MPDSLRLNNGSLYIHTFLTPDGYKSPADAPKTLTAYRSQMITKYKKLQKYKRTRNLLTGESEVKEEDILEDPKLAPIIPHFHKNFTVNVIYDVTPFKKGSLPPPLNEFIKFSENGAFYEPTIFFNSYWNLQRDYYAINETVNSAEISISLYPLSMMKFQIYASQSVQNNWMKELTGQSTDDSDQDTLKEMLLDTNPILVGTTFIVSILHMIFEFLAFKNDIQFWNTKKEGKDMQGLSIRSVGIGIVQSTIVFLYILDNEANFMVLVNVFIGMLIDFWKISKVLQIYKTANGPKTVENKKEDEKPAEAEDTQNSEYTEEQRKTLGLDAPENQPKKLEPWKMEIGPYTIQEYAAYCESPTKIYDQMAFNYLGKACIPLFIGYGIYSFMYNEHKGYYSFVLGMCYGFLLVFGFIMMTPQLFINYKLKSTAHLPWRMLTYKFINTFIDDLFAFVIKMPTLYRLGCFRDDIVFFIYLYQKWIYKVDYSRVNEFGTTGEQHKEKKEGEEAIEDKKTK